MAMIAGIIGAQLAGPIIGMIPSAPGGPQNPFSTSNGSSGGIGGFFDSLFGSGGAVSSLAGTASNTFGNGISFLKSPQALLIGGGVILVIILLK